MRRSKTFWLRILANKSLGLPGEALAKTGPVRRSFSEGGMIRRAVISTLIFLIDSIRPFLGPSNVCIYQVSCTNYAKKVLREKNILVALGLIILRLISCNPITAICKIMFYKINGYASAFPFVPVRHSLGDGVKTSDFAKASTDISEDKKATAHKKVIR